MVMTLPDEEFKDLVNGRKQWKEQDERLEQKEIKEYHKD